MNFKESISLKFCKVYYNKNDFNINKTIHLINKAFDYNKNFFRNIHISKFKVIIVYSRKELDNLWGKKTQKFVSAFANKKTIIIFSPKAMKIETCWKESEFFSTMVHEINHLFFEKIRKHEYKPLWLSEGLATYLQHHKKITHSKKRIKISYNTLNQPCKNLALSSYNIFIKFTEYLIKKYGSRNIIKLLKTMGKGKNLKNSIVKVYGKTIKELIKDANEN